MKALVRRGHDVELLIPPYDNPADAGRCWTDGGVRIQNLPLSGGHPSLVWRLARHALAARPDVVHGFKPIGPAGLAALLLTRRVPVVVDCDDWEGVGGWADAGGYSWPIRLLMDEMERLVPARVPALTAASRTLVRRLRRRGIPMPRIVYLPNCVDRGNLAAPVPARTPDDTRCTFALPDAPIVLYVGRIPEENDLDLARDALARLAAGRSFSWVLVGDGEGLKPLRRSIPLELAGRTYFLGRLDRPDLAAILSAARLMLVPVRDTPINRAKCAMKIVDSLAAGLPVVTPDVGQNREYVVNGVTGLLTPPGDTAALASAVADLLDDPVRASGLGAAAATRMRGGYTWDHWAGEAERAYRIARGG